MPKRKASAWPASILSDPDVLSLDDEGRFVLCKICHVHYAVHGGKKPKPVVMNSNFRTRAWDVHKLRTNSHRIQREHERAVKAQQERLRLEHERTQATADQQQKQQQQKEQQQPTQELPTSTSSSATSSLAPATTTSSVSDETKRRGVQAENDSAARGFAGEMMNVMSQVDRLDQWRREQKQHEAEVLEQETSFLRNRQLGDADAGSEQRVGNRMRSLTLPGLSSDGFVSRLREQREGGSTPSSPRSGEDKAAAAAAVVATLRHPFQLPLAVLPNRSQSTGLSVLAGVGQAENRHLQSSGITSAQMEGMTRWQHMHDDVSRALRLGPSKRRRSGVQPDGRVSANSSSDSKSSGDVNVMRDGQGKLAETYTRRELRVATALAGTEEMTGNNRERVARKLKSLNDQYHARNLRAEDTTAFLDPASSGHKAFWGTLRDVYSSSSMAPANKESATDGRTDRSTHHHHHHYHHYYPERHPKDREKQAASGTEFGNQVNEFKSEDSMESEAPPQMPIDESDSTTPGSASNSSDGAIGKNAQKQKQKQQLLVGPDHQHQQSWPVTHDQLLEGAFDRLTGVVSNELTEILVHEAEIRQLALSDLTMAVTELGTQQRDTANRFMDLQERNLDTMERILHHKLRRERASLLSEQSQEMKGEETKEDSDQL